MLHHWEGESRLSLGLFSRPMTPLADAVRDYVQGYLVAGKKLGE